MIFAVLATGPSMSQEVADSVRGKCKVIAVSDTYKLAPWADAMCSSDAAWWKANPDAIDFAGQRYAAMPEFQKIEGVECLKIPSGSNSGLLALHVAVMRGAKKILMMGFDMKGSHYFGPHKSLKNTTPARFEIFKRQFAQYKPAGVDIVNCTPGSALKAYRIGKLEDELC